MNGGHEISKEIFDGLGNKCSLRRTKTGNAI